MNKTFIAVISGLVGAVVGGAGADYFAKKEINKKNAKVDKFRCYYNVLNQWLVVKQHKKSLSEYFESNQYKSVAIYGMGELGNRLYDELKETDIVVKYAIDKEPETVYSELEIFSKEDLVNCEAVDVVIVTAVFAFDEIERELKEIISYPVKSLEDVVYEM